MVFAIGFPRNNMTVQRVLKDGANSEFSGARWRPRTGHFTTLQMFAGIYRESTFHTCKNDRETLYRGKLH